MRKIIFCTWDHYRIHFYLLLAYIFIELTAQWKSYKILFLYKTKDFENLIIASIVIQNKVRPNKITLKQNNTLQHGKSYKTKMDTQSHGQKNVNITFQNE